MREKGRTGYTGDINICLNCPLPWCIGGRDYGELHDIRTGAKKKPVYFCPRDLAIYHQKLQQANRLAPRVLTRTGGLTKFREILEGECNSGGR